MAHLASPSCWAVAAERDHCSWAVEVEVCHRGILPVGTVEVDETAPCETVQEKNRKAEHRKVVVGAAAGIHGRSALEGAVVEDIGRCRGGYDAPRPVSAFVDPIQMIPWHMVWWLVAVDVPVRRCSACRGRASFGVHDVATVHGGCVFDRDCSSDCHGDGLGDYRRMIWTKGDCDCDYVGRDPASGLNRTSKMKTSVAEVETGSGGRSSVVAVEHVQIPSRPRVVSPHAQAEWFLGRRPSARLDRALRTIHSHCIPCLSRPIPCSA